MITLTINEIYDLAFVAGLPLDQLTRPKGDDGEMTISVGPCPEMGLHCETSGKTRKYRMIAWFEEYPEEGSMGLGPELNAKGHGRRAGAGTQDDG